MSESHPSGYFTVFEGIYCKDRPFNRRPAAPKSQTSAKAKVVIILALLVLGAGTATAALTASQRGVVTGLARSQSATFINLPGILTFEDALY